MNGILELAFVTLAACAAGSLPVRATSDRAVHADEIAYSTTLQVRFLGAAGFLIRRGQDVVLTAPLYSTPSLFKVLDERAPVILPRLDRIARFHPDAEDVQAILVGHAHYDHLMDVPYVWERTPSARIFGSLTMKNILLGYRGLAPSPVPEFASHVPRIDPSKVVALDDPKDPTNLKVDTRSCHSWAPGCDAGHACPVISQAGDWVPVGQRIRVRALCARHPPQFLKYHQACCCVSSRRETPPSSIDEFREGNVFVYLIDFLDDLGAPAFRVYFQDVPTDGEVGHVPEDLLAERPVDVALLCAGNSKDVSEPEKIVANLKPGAVIVGHWEDFFRPQDKPLEEAPFQQVARYVGCLRRELDSLGQVTGRPLYLPKPGVLMTFPRPKEGQPRGSSGRLATAGATP
jgi:hypothetical protein